MWDHVGPDASRGSDLGRSTRRPYLLWGWILEGTLVAVDNVSLSPLFAFVRLFVVAALFSMLSQLRFLGPHFDALCFQHVLSFVFIGQLVIQQTT